MMDKKSGNGLASQAVEGAGQRKQLPYSVETPYGFHLDLDFLKYVDDIEKGNTIKRVHIQRRARGPKFSTLPRNFSLPGHGARPPPKDTWSGTSTLGSKPKSRVTEVQQIFDFKPSNGGTSSQIRAPAPGGSYTVARPKEEARVGVRPFEEQPLVLQARPNLLRTSSMPASVPQRKGSDSGDERSGGSQNGSSKSVFRPADVLDRRVPQDRTGLHQQITVALRRVRELEEQVRTIPELKAQICSLREEREKLLLRLQAQTQIQTQVQTQTQAQVQAQAQAASPPQTKTPGPASDSQPREAAAPELTSTEGVSERQSSAEDRRSVADKPQEPPSSCIAQPDAGKLLTQPSDGQREGNSLEAKAGTLSGSGAVQGTTDGSENPASAEGETAVTVQVSSDEDLASIRQLQAKLTNLEEKLTLASHDLDRTNVLLKEQVEENRLKEERILLLSEGAGEMAPPEAGRGRRESVDRETETDKVDLANQETETESAGTVDKGTDMAMIEVCIPQERYQGTETERLDAQHQLMDVDGREGRHRANSVDQGTETERVDTADQVTETQAPSRVDQVTETETNSPGLHPVRPRANSVERGTVTERVDTVDQVTETEGVTREDRQTETVAERQDRETNHPGGSVEFGGMVTGTFLTESVVMECVVMENVFEKVDNLVTDVALTESSAPDQNAVAEIEVNKITVTDSEVEESVVRENVLVQTVVEEQNIVVEVEETEVVIDGPSESSREAPESVAPVNVALESVILVTKVTLESAVPENVTTERKVPESESIENKVLENVAPETEAPVVEAPETEAPVVEAPETEAPVVEAPETEAPVVEATMRTATELSAPKRPPRHIPASAQAAQTPEHSLVQPPAKIKAQPEPPPLASNEASSSSQPPPQASNEASSSSQPPPQASNEASSPSQPPPQASSEASPSQPPPRASNKASSPSQPPPRASIEAPSTSQPPPRASNEASSTQPPRRGSSEASQLRRGSSEATQPRRGSGESPTSPAALGQVVTRLTGLLNEQWAQLGSGGQQGATQQQQEQDGTGGQKAAAKQAAKAAGKTADKPAGKTGPSKMSSIQNQLVSSLSALSAFYSPGQKAAASKQQGLKSIMKKNEGAGKQGGAKKNLKFVGVNGGYESTSSEESSGDDKEQEEEEVQEEEEEDSSDPEEQEPAEEHQDQAQTEQETTQREASDPGAQGGGVEAEAQEEPLDPESSKAEQATGVTVDKDFMEACLYIRDHMTAVSSPDKEMRQVLLVLYQEWFHVSSQKDSQAHIVTLYLREVGVATPTLLRYIVNLTDGNGNTALHYSVSHGNFPVVKLLLDTGLCEVDTQNKAGYTAVMLACLTAAEASEDMEVALQLLRQGDVNARAGQSGQTALMLAVSHGRIAMVRLLLTCPVDVNIQDHSGSTALMCASEHGHTDITRLLLEAGLCHTGLTNKNEQTALSLALLASHGEIVDLLRAHSDAPTSDPPATTAPL